MNKFIIIFILFYFNFAFCISSEQEDELRLILLLESEIDRNPTEEEMIENMNIPKKDLKVFFHKIITETKYDKTFKNNELYTNSILVNNSISCLSIWGGEDSLKILRPFWEDTDKDNRFKSTAIFSSILLSNFNENLLKEILNKEYVEDTITYYSIADQIFQQYKKMREENNASEQIRLLKILKMGSEMPYSKEEFLDLLKRRNFDIGFVDNEIKELDNKLYLDKNEDSKITKINLEKTEIIKNSKETENQDSTETENEKSISLNAENSKSKILIIFGVLFTIIFGGLAICKTRKKKNRKQEEK